MKKADMSDTSELSLSLTGRESAPVVDKGLFVPEAVLTTFTVQAKLAGWPEVWVDDATRYLGNHRMPGPLVYAALCNRLDDVCERLADNTLSLTKDDVHLFLEFVRGLARVTPARAWGSAAAVDRWVSVARVDCPVCRKGVAVRLGGECYECQGRGFMWARADPAGGRKRSLR